MNLFRVFLVVKKDAIQMSFNFTMEPCKPATGQKTTDNKRIMPAEQLANTILVNFPSKMRFVFRSKTSLTKDSLTQKRSNVQGNNDVTKQSQCH